MKNEPKHKHRAVREILEVNKCRPTLANIHEKRTWMWQKHQLIWDTDQGLNNIFIIESSYMRLKIIVNACFLIEIEEVRKNNTSFQ